MCLTRQRLFDGQRYKKKYVGVVLSVTAITIQIFKFSLFNVHHDATNSPNVMNCQKIVTLVLGWVLFSE